MAANRRSSAPFAGKARSYINRGISRVVLERAPVERPVAANPERRRVVRIGIVAALTSVRFE